MLSVRGLTVLLGACLVAGGIGGAALAYARRPAGHRGPTASVAPRRAAGAPIIDADALAQPLQPLQAHPVPGPDVFVIEADSARASVGGGTGRLELDDAVTTVLGVANGKSRTVLRTKTADFVAAWPGTGHPALIIGGQGGSDVSFSVQDPTFDATSNTMRLLVTGVDDAARAWLEHVRSVGAVTLFVDVTPGCLAPRARSCSYARLRGRDLAHHDFSDVDLYRAELVGANLTGADFTHAWIGGADFSYASASNARFVGLDPRLATTTEAHFDGATLTSATFSGELQGTTFVGAHMHGATLTAASLASAEFVGADLTGADLTGADLSNANFDGADLAGADLGGAMLVGAQFESANLRGAHLEAADLTNARLPHADLSSASLVDATLRGTQLPGAILAGARLVGATMFGADLGHASLYGAHIGGFAQPIAKLGDAWKSSSSYFPTVLDMAGYTCGTQRPDGSFDDADCRYEPAAFPGVVADAAATVGDPETAVAHAPARVRVELKELLGA